MKILLNGAKCMKCGETIYSRHVHDFKYCSCKSLFVDGGNDYLRRGGSLDSYEEASCYNATTDKGGECAGMFLVYSPQGQSNATTAFVRKEDAIKSAERMKEQYGGTWYVTGPLESLR